MRRLLLSLALAMSLSEVGASSALAEAPEGAQKAPLYGPNAASAFSCEGGVAPTPKTFGIAIFGHPSNEMTLTGEVSLKHARLKTTSRVLTVQDISGFCTFVPAGEITTNKKGNGNLHVSGERLPGSTKFWIAIEGGAETYGSPAVELDWLAQARSLIVG